MPHFWFYPGNPANPDNQDWQDKKARNEIESVNLWLQL